MAQMRVELHVLGPRDWVENRRAVRWNPPEDTAYHVHPGKVCFKDYYARHFYISGLIRAIRASQPQIIQLLEEPWSLTAAQTLLAASLFAPQAKIIFYTWENIYRPWVYPSRLSPLYRQIDRAMHQRSTGAVCATEGAKAVLEQKGYNKPAVAIPYGIPQFFFEHGDPKNQATQTQPQRQFTVGFIGRLMHMKGIDLLLQAARQIPDLHLIICGSGEDEERLKQMAQESKITQRVEWLPPRDEHQIPALLQQMDVLVLPSRRVEGWQEQLGRAIEAMRGNPVIAPPGAIPERSEM